MEKLIEITQNSWAASVAVLMMGMFFAALLALLWMDWRWMRKHNSIRKRRNAKIWRRAEKHGVA